MSVELPSARQRTPIQPSDDRPTYCVGERELRVNGAKTSKNGQNAVLYIEGKHPNIGMLNEKSIDGKDETIVFLHSDEIPQLKRVKNPDGSIKETFNFPGTPISKTVIGKQLAPHGRALEVYLSGSFPGLGEPHIGWTGYETIVRIPLEYKVIMPTHAMNKNDKR